jgi:hypothetical protein
MIYVITSGEYDDYGIVSVGTDRARAEAYVAAVNEFNGYEHARIEEYEDQIDDPPVVYSWFSAGAHWDELNGWFKDEVIAHHNTRLGWHPEMKANSWDSLDKGRNVNREKAEKNEDGSWKLYRVWTCGAEAWTAEEAVRLVNEMKAEFNARQA